MDSQTTKTKIEKGEIEMEDVKVVNQEEELAKHKAAHKKTKKVVKKVEATTPKPKVQAKKAKAVKKGEIYVKPAHTKGIITTKHLEEEFGITAKVIRRYLRKMEASTKPRGAERYEWEASSKELKTIRTNLEAIKAASISNVR